MSDQANLIWIDVTPDFEPVAYAKAYAEDDVVKALGEADSLEAQLLCLYENGYLAKRSGKIQYLLPEDDAQVTQVAEGVGARLKALHKAGKEASEFGKGIVSKGTTAKQYASGAMKAMSKKEKVGLGAAAAGSAVGGALAARALYKKLKARKKKEESLDEKDIEFLIDEATLLGLEFDSAEELGEALDLGNYIDDVLADAENEGLTENYSEEDIVYAALNSLNEQENEEASGEPLDERVMKAAKEAYKKGKEASIFAGKGVSSARSGGKVMTPGRLGKAKAAAVGAKEAGKAAWGAMGKGQKAAAVGAGVAGAGLAARALYKKMKARKEKKESLGEKLDSFDLQHIITDAQELGFEFEGYEDLVEALDIGKLIDSTFDYYLDGAELVEELNDEDVMEALLVDIDEAFGARMLQLGQKLKGAGSVARGAAAKGYTRARAAGAGRMAAGMRAARGAGKAQWHSMGKLGKAGVIGAGAAGAAGAGALAYKKLKKKQESQEEPKNESLEFKGYRSSAQGSIYESAPIPYGTGNKLYERIQGLLKTDDGQTLLESCKEDD